MARATRFPLAKLRLGRSKTASRAEKSEAKVRRPVQARRRMPGHWNSTDRSTKARSAALRLLVHVHDDAAKEGERGAVGGVEGAQDLGRGRDQEDEQRQQRQEGVVGDGGGAVGPVVVPEAIEGAPGEPRRVPDHTRFWGRAGRISTRLRWAPSRVRSRSRTAPATSSGVSIHEASARGRAAEGRVHRARGQGRDLDPVLADLEHEAGRRAGRGRPCSRSRRPCPRWDCCPPAKRP